jgi:hypothetical protein
MLADNRTVIPDAKISYIGWLTKEGNLKRASSIVVEFTDPGMANAVIYAGMAWDGQIHQCQLYERACRTKQCFRCYHYGHITTQCNASQVCGYCVELHETKHCRRKEVEGFTPRCAVCKDNHTAWSNACPARRKEMKRVEQAKEVRSIYWHVPPKEASGRPGTPSGHRVNIRRDDTTATLHSATQPLEEIATHAEPEPGYTGTQLSQHTRPLTGTPDMLEATALQRLATSSSEEAAGPPVPMSEPSQEHAEDTGDVCHGPNLGESEEPLVPTYSDLGLAGVLEQEADDWLAHLADNHDNNWLSTIPEIPEPSPATSLATGTLTAQGSVYKGCRCPEHQEIYKDWPVRDAELTVAKCMRVCVYCGKDFPTTSALRGHMKRVYVKRNLAITLENRGRWSTAPPSWTLLPGPRRTRGNSNTESITVAPLQ